MILRLILGLLLCTAPLTAQVVILQDIGSCLVGQVPVRNASGGFDCFSTGFGRVYYPKHSANSDLVADTAVTATYKQANLTPSAGAENDLVINSPTVTPLGHNASSSVTGTMNSSAVTGTLNSFDNRSAFVKVIFCSKN